jgi:mRNA interferase MazF
MTRTLSITAYEKGDVILVSFPFSNQSAVKKRPAIIISSNTYNNISRDVVIMAITSQIEKTIGIGECLITNWQEAGLLKPSAIKTAISTIEKSLIIRKLGTLTHNDRISMENALKEFLDLK